MIRKMLAGAALAASVAVVGAAAAPATAIGNVRGSLDKPCLGVPVKVVAGSFAGVIPVSAQDVGVLASPRNRQCAESPAQAESDELSHAVDDNPVLSGNGVANS